MAGIGTHEWREAQALRRQDRSAVRLAVLALAGRATGEGQFADVAAPSGAGETVDRRGFGGYCGDTAALPLEVRRVARAGRLVRRQMDRRAAVLAAARARRTAQVAQARQALPAVDLEGRTITLTAVRPVDAITAVEEHILTRDARRQALASLMAVLPDRDGRGTVNGHVDTVVNGTEVRHSRRWQSTPRAAVLTQTGTAEDGTAEYGPVDWQCYRVNGDGTRTPLVTTATAKRRKRRATGTTAAAKRAALQAVAGTLGVDAQG